MNAKKPPSPPGARARAQPAVGRDQHLHSGGVDPLHLLGVPVAGVREHRGGCLGDPGVTQVAQRSVSHRLKATVVRAGRAQATSSVRRRTRCGAG